MILVELVYNLSLLVALSIVSGFFDRRYPRTTLTGLIIQGLLFGIVALVGMIHPMNLGMGLIFDGRSIVISLSTLFFGPISGSIAGMIVIITGIIQGGSGIVPGTLVVIFSVIIGSIFHFQKKKRNEEITIRLLLYLGYSIHIVMLFMMFSLPFQIAISAIQRIGIPVIICYPLATVLIGKILSDQEINFRIIEDLIASEIKYRSFFENSMDAILLTNSEEKTLSANQAACKMFGYSEEELINLGRSGITDKTDSQLPILLSDRALNGKAHGEVSLIRKDGTSFHAEISTANFKNQEGLTRASMIIRDITERKLAEEELRFRNLILSTQQEASINGILIIDENAIIISYNQRFVEMWGIPPELIEKKFNDPVLKSILNKVADPESFLQRIKYLNEHKKETSWDEIVLKNGWIFERYSAPMEGPDNRYYGRVWYFRDITESKQAEEEVRDSEERFRMVFENVFDGISIYSEDPEPSKRKLIECNEQYSNMAGRSRNELLQLGSTLGLQITITDKANDNRLESLHSGIAYQGTFSWIRPDGKENFIEYVGMPITWRGKSLSISIDRDITEHKHTEKELLEAKEKAEKSDKLKTEFLAQMSHEIRTPLNAIIGNINYLNDYFNNIMEQESRDCFDSIYLASKRIIRTIDLILNAAQLQSSEYKPHFVKIDLNSEILNKVYHEHQLSASQKGLEFIYTCKENDMNVLSDEYSITQIFANLIDNAIKYTKKGKVEILLEKNKTGNITVEVKDTGIGINKEFLPRIFEPFTQEEQGYTRSFEGNGLGLALVKRYCELNNIIIEVDSVKNEGSTFRIIFISLHP
jgi:PAS domain S-box-containing protein